MTQPVFGATSFEAGAVPNAQDAFDLITGEVLQNAIAAHPERSFLVDENVQAVADRLHSADVLSTQAAEEALASPYIGLWIIVAFALGDHRSRFGMEIVTAARPADEKVPLRYGLTAIFDTEAYGEKLARVAVGSPLTCMGQLDQLNANEIRLRNCEFV